QSYAELVAQTNRELGAEPWLFDPVSGQLQVGGAVLTLPQREADVLVLLAACSHRGQGIRCPLATEGTDPEWAKEVRMAITGTFGQAALSSAFDNWLAEGPDHKNGFDQALSRLKSHLRQALGTAADPIDNAAPGCLGRRRAYALRLPPEQFQLVLKNPTTRPTR
ncbi:MAG: hypothetical protein ACK4XK_08870, partial [Casimicrobiaceae bacterium]